jgi:uncharacterized lipoprotein YajG
LDFDSDYTMKALFVLAGLFLLAVTAMASVPQIEIKASQYRNATLSTTGSD